ncbi:MAG TPA: 6-bladed beta-propeller [Bacteroidales bacterium]|nr:6-bladed beta-propeller [Bacteroidales bacterium]
MRNFLFSILALLLFSCNAGNEDRVVTTVNIDGRKIPVIHFDKLPDELIETGISEIIDDYRVIPLETKEECLVGNAMTYLFEDKIIVGTQINFPDPVTCYMFDDKGRFIKNVGAGGNGPGEHSGYLVSSLFPLIDTNMFVMSFTSENQLFDSNGDYVSDVKQPYELMGNSVSYSGDIWYSPGAVKGHPHYRRDSNLLVIHRRDGEIINRIPRTVYPPSADKGFTPTGGSGSLHNYDNKWHLYSPGNDTVYSLDGENVIHEYILDRGTKGQKYNTIVEPESIIGKYDYSIAAETDDQWLVSCSEVTKADVREYRPGQWGGSYNFSFDMALIDKNRNRATRMEVYDDLFSLIDNRAFNSRYYYITGNRIVFAQQASDLKVKIAERLKEDDLDPAQRKRLEELDSQIDENSNPVVFIFTLKENIEL